MENSNEWNVKEAYIIDKFNEKIIDLKNNNLHLVGYSEPINKILNKKKLLPYLHSLPNQPNAIPYVTSSTEKIGDFVLQKIKKKIKKKYSSNDKFRIFIISSFNKNGNLNYEIGIKR